MYGFLLPLIPILAFRSFSGCPAGKRSGKNKNISISQLIRKAEEIPPFSDKPKAEVNIPTKKQYLFPVFLIEYPQRTALLTENPRQSGEIGISSAFLFPASEKAKIGNTTNRIQKRKTRR